MLFWDRIFFMLRKMEEAFLIVMKNKHFKKLIIRNNLKV